MDELKFDDDGSIMRGAYGPVVAFLDQDGKTLKPDRYSNQVLAYIEDDGTILVNRYSNQVLGFVKADGTVMENKYSNKILGHVSPPHLMTKAALLLVR